MRVTVSTDQGGKAKYSSGVGTGTMRMGERMPARWKHSTVNSPPTRTRSQRLAVATQLWSGLPSNASLGTSGNSQAGTMMLGTDDAKTMCWQATKLTWIG